MATTLTSLLKASFLNNYGMLEKAIDACPESAWTQRNGKLPFWQQAGHAFSGIDFLMRGKDEPAYDIGLDPALFDLKNKEAKAPGKAEVKAMAQRMMACGAAHIDKLSDADLTSMHEGLKTRVGWEMPVLAALSLVISHAMYHLGVCDSILRDNDLPGIL